MRVVGGRARGRALEAPPGRQTRPTSDRVREAVFSSLGSLGPLEGAAVVDLFAGSGAMGIEALSRGADTATFVERDRAALAAIRANLSALDLGGPGVRVLAADALAAAGEMAVTAGADLVFADPPYRFEDWPLLLRRLVSTGFCGLLVAESGGPVAVAQDWEVVRRKAYGSTVVTMLRPGSIPQPADRIEGGPIR